MAATAILLLRSRDAEALARDHHLGLRPTGDAAAAMGEVSLLLGDPSRSALWAEEAVRREDRARPGVFSVIRTMAGLRLADLRVAAGDVEGARDALAIAVPPRGSDAEDWRWLVESVGSELPGGHISRDLVDRGLALVSIHPSIAASALRLATRLHLGSGGDPALARRVVDVGLALDAADPYVAGVVVRALEWLAEAGGASADLASDVVALTERFDDLELQARALIVAASVTPSRATELVERAVRLHPTHQTRLNRAILLNRTKPAQAREIAVTLEREATVDSRWSDAADAAFLAACGNADRPEDDLQRALMYARSADHATLFAPRNQAVWVELLRAIERRDAQRAWFLKSLLFGIAPPDARESWIAAFRTA